MKAFPSNKILNLLVVFVIPLFNLGFTSIYIPNFMDISAFADWRFASSLIAFAGVLHFGAADGLYIFWLGHRDIVPNIDRRIFVVVFFLIALNALIVSLIVYSHDFFSVVEVAFLFLALLASCIFSFSNYYALVFLKKNYFRLAIASQSVMFVLCIIVVNILGILSAPVAIASYAFSCMPLSYIMLRGVKLSVNKSNLRGSLLKIFKIGFPILLANLLIIFFINFDKLYARFYFGSDGLYAIYSVESSIFVASCGLGMSVGAYLISNGNNFLRSKFRLLIIMATGSVAIATSPLISKLLNFLITSYIIDYTYFSILSIFSLIIFATYVSYCKFYLPKLCQKIFIFFPIFYSVALTVSTHLSDIPFDHLSAIFLLIFLIFTVMIIEMRGGDDLEKFF